MYRSSIAAFFHPAYEIGADWYDALRIGDVSYGVIADVCDKGVGSAVFMSVFRTLLRYSLLQLSGEPQSMDGIDLSSVMTLVNDCMATTHGSSTMFATVFLAAYRPASRTLSYVTAGHESPLILRAHVLTSLEITCPHWKLAPSKMPTASRMPVPPRMLPGASALCGICCSASMAPA